MRRRIKDYTVYFDEIGKLDFLVIDADFGVDMSEFSNKQIEESIRLVIDETERVLLTSSMKKGNIAVINRHDTTWVEILFYKDSFDTIKSTDSFTIEVDTGEVPTYVSSISEDFINSLT